MAFDRTPTAPLSVEEYLEVRVEKQRKWFARQASLYSAQRTLIGAVVILLSGLSSWISGLDGLASFGLTAPKLNVVSALLMSVTTALTGWATLSSTEYLASTFRGTAKQLRRLARDWHRGERYVGPLGFAEFVEDVERLIARQNASWSQRIIQTSGTAPPPDAPPSAPPADEGDPNEGEVRRVGGGDER